MSTTFWTIDLALQLHPAPEIPPSAVSVDRPEQLIDTIILRNLNTITNSWFGLSSKVLFHSTDFWGPFDIGCILADGVIVAFENKSKSVNKAALEKFYRDIVTVSSGIEKYCEERFKHVARFWKDYLFVAERMFAGFYLGLRCDREKNSRDLTAEAIAMLSTTREAFLADFRRGNTWLDSMGPSLSLPAYLGEFASTLRYERLRPVLLVPSNCVRRIQAWLPTVQSSNTTSALFASYRFFADGTKHPQWLAITSPSDLTRPPRAALDKDVQV